MYFWQFPLTRLFLLLAIFLLLNHAAAAAQTAANHAPSVLGYDFSATATPNLSIPDNLYRGVDDGNDGFGPDAGMVCSTIDSSSGIPTGALVTNVVIDLDLNHTFVGDLTVKLKSPDGTILALYERPQGDGTGNNTGDNGDPGPNGDSSDLSAFFPLNFADGNPYDAEDMGKDLSDSTYICRDDNRCDFFPNPDQALVVGSSVANFAAFNGGAASGGWTLCAGDGAGLDVGNINSWTLNLDYNVSADLSLSQTAPASASPINGNFFYNIDWQNAGPTGATGVTISDTLPGEVSFVNAGADCLESGGVVTCGLGYLSAGSSGTITIEVTPLAAGLTTNTATISSTAPDPDPSDNSASTTTRIFDPDVYSSSQPAVAIPDDGYIGVGDGNDGFGADAGMVCDVIDTGVLVPSNAVVTQVAVDLGATHNWVGDLTVKLRSPDGTILALLERPQGDNATNNTGDNGMDSPSGDNSNLAGPIWINFADGNPIDPETMGAALTTAGTVCADDNQCTFAPNPDQALVQGSSVANFAAFSNEEADGLWMLCVGDSVRAIPADPATFESWAIWLDYELGDYYTFLPSVLRP